MKLNTSHLFHLGQIEPQYRGPGGSRTAATAKNFPHLKGMSLYKLTLNKLGIREPHWHANADELGYCLKGEVLVSIYANGDSRTSFLVRPGETFFVPSGSLHAVENVGENEAELILQFSHEEPEDFGLSSTLWMFTDAVLGNTWHTPKEYFKSLKRGKEPVFISMGEKRASIPESARYSSPYRYNLAGAPPLIKTKGGEARVSRANVWPILKRQALYSLHLTGKGMREPHWHPETAEMGYVEEGKGRMSILSPSGSIDTYEMNPGDIYFIPKAYPHHIENLLESPLKLLIFFDQPMPGDIGLTASVKSFSEPLLTSVFETPPDFFHELPTYYADLFIVDKL